ncbi:hypothetical protein KY284_030254 [Solanum tuberosum]|nr:hypothetical protein KY284_030254 [Solanum tuberosum]
MSKSVLSDRLARWYLQFQQFEITYIFQKAIKGQVLADFLDNHPIPNDWELSDKLPDEDAILIEIKPPWKMYFDGAAHREGAGAGVVFVTSYGDVLPYSFTLTQHNSNNVVEYQALLLGLEMVVDIKQLQLQIYDWLGEVTIQHIPRKENKKTDALTTLASALASPDQMQVVVFQKWIAPQPDEHIEEFEQAIDISEAEIEDWRQPIIDYLCYGILPENLRRRT